MDTSKDTHTHLNQVSPSSPHFSIRICPGIYHSSSAQKDRRSQAIYLPGHSSSPLSTTLAAGLCCY